MHKNQFHFYRLVEFRKLKIFKAISFSHKTLLEKIEQKMQNLCVETIKHCLEKLMNL